MAKFTTQYFVINGVRVSAGNAAIKHNIDIDSLLEMLPGESQSISGVLVTRCEV